MFYKLNIGSKESNLKKYWRMFFLFFGFNAAVGIVAHGFKSYFSEEVFKYVWLSMNLASVPITFYLFKANVENSKFEGKTKNAFNLIILFTSFVFVALTILLNNFVVVKVSALLAILVTIVAHYRTYRNGIAGSGYITFGFAFSVSALIVHGAKWSISEWFNYKDISHVIMNISLIIIFVGVQQKLRSTNTIEREELEVFDEIMA